MSDVLEELKVILGADVSDYEKKLDRVQKAQKKMGDDLAEVGKELTLKVTGPILATAAAFTFMAAEEQAAEFRMAASLNNVKVHYADVDDNIHTVIGSLETLSSFEDTALTNSFTNLLNITKNYNNSLAALPVVADLARGANMDLESATQLVGKAMTGNVQGLKRYGIALAEGSTAVEVMAQLQARFGGSAAAFSQTVAGAWENLKNQGQNLAENWGKVLLPAAMSIIRMLTTLVEWGARMGTAFDALPKGVKLAAMSFVALVAAVGPAVYMWGKLVAYGPAIISFLTGIGSTMAVIVLQVAFFASLAALVIANWSSVKALFSSILYGVAAAFTFLLERAMAFVEFLTSKIPGLGGVMKDLHAKVDELATGMGTAFTDAASGIVAPADAMKNTMDMLGGTWDSLMAKFAMPVPPPNTLPHQAVWDSFMAHLKATSKDMADNITQNMAQAMGGLVSAIAQGTLDGKAMLKAFLIQTLEAIVTWAASAALAALGLSQAIAAAMTNPVTAVFVIGGLMGAIYALSANGPALAAGGMTTGLTTGVTLGDNNSGQEVVLPLDSPRTTAALSKAMPDGGGFAEQTIIVYIGEEEVTRAVVHGMPSILRLSGVTSGA